MKKQKNNTRDIEKLNKKMNETKLMLKIRKMKNEWRKKGNKSRASNALIFISLMNSLGDGWL